MATSNTARRRTYCNIPTAEFGMISAETACWDIERKCQIFKEDFYLPLYLPLWCGPFGRVYLHGERTYMDENSGSRSVVLPCFSSRLLVGFDSCSKCSLQTRDSSRRCFFGFIHLSRIDRKNLNFFNLHNY
jgi:hypothetical protein